jgi:FkbM family methyltransferase
MMKFRERHHRAIWRMLWPVRKWIQHFPIHRGKGLIFRWIILPALPPKPAAFEYSFGDGMRVSLFFREDLGTNVLFGGGYEASEVRELCRHCVAGTSVIDAGANIGLTSLELSRSLTVGGKVFAFEPHPDTAARLRQNLVRNNVGNVEVLETALADRTGSIVFHESADPTLSSASLKPRNLQRSFEVPVTTIDTIWHQKGKPDVSLLKIDIEGGELAALRGGCDLLKACRPAILLEAWSDDLRAPIDTFLTNLGYAAHQPEGFETRNYLYLHQA